MLLSAACHIHSDWSYDGKWTLPALAEEFSRRGYRILMVTEHDRGFTDARLKKHRDACAEASTDKIFILPGIEYSDAENRVHILTWGPMPFLGESNPTDYLLSSVKGAGGVAVFAHPSRRDAWKLFDPKWKDNLLGIEIWNRKTDGWAPSKTAAPLLDENVTPFVGMDFHTKKQMFPLSMALDIPATVDEKSVMACLRARRCGPRFLGRPLRAAVNGPLNLGLKIAEGGRRGLANAYRFCRK